MLLSWRRKALAAIIALVTRLLLRTLRVEYAGPLLVGGGVVAFPHGEQLPLLLLRPHGPLMAPISLSRDGALQVEVMRWFNISAARGSSSQGALSALRGLDRHLRVKGAFVLIAVDGPRGPRLHAQPGAAALARRASRPLWLCRAHCDRAIRLKSWDHFLIPLPFSRLILTTHLISAPPHEVSLHSALQARLYEIS
jgi:lysophospholipid acyltransferase (LPLAT)-like uncharacterized protein